MDIMVYPEMLAPNSSIDDDGWKAQLPSNCNILMKPNSIFICGCTSWCDILEPILGGNIAVGPK